MSFQLAAVKTKRPISKPSMSPTVLYIIIISINYTLNLRISIYINHDLVTLVNITFILYIDTQRTIIDT